ncbi:helix-turn-helix domain-containing protein [Candidatus Peregrinibacteria bacterium]|nr:helix-turn-helix domain-containing protein [Candidatus Peregrinibacteria bacterium]
MLPKKLIGALQELGLSEKESCVYLAMLTLGEASVLQIARAAEIKRPTVYPVLESLQQKGLVHIDIRSMKQRYRAINPERLELLLEQRRKNLLSALPELTALYNTEGSQSLIQYFEGLEAVKTVYESNIRDIQPHENYCVIADQKKWIGLDQKYFENFTYRRGLLPINIRLLLSDTPIARAFQKKERYYNETIRFLPKGTELTTNLVITPQRPFMHQLTPPVNGIVIENKSAIKTQMELFEILWKSLDTRDSQ